MSVSKAVKKLVCERAGDACEYCGLLQTESPLAKLHVEHIIPIKHGGDDSESNLALACIDCNLHKGPNLTGIDPTSGKITRLFHPRRQAWTDHFYFEGIRIVGRTAVGRTTVEVLCLNSEERLELRS